MLSEHPSGSSAAPKHPNGCSGSNPPNPNPPIRVQVRVSALEPEPEPDLPTLTDDARKVNWIAGEKVFLDKEFGGLSIANIKPRNVAMLLKWWIKFSSDNNALWKKVLVEKYYRGFSNLSVNCVESRIISRLWLDILNIGNLKTEANHGPLIKECFSWSIGNGQSTRFWHNNLISPTPLKLLFPRLFALADNQSSLVSHMGFFSDSSNLLWNWRLTTARPIRGRALSEQQQLLAFLQNFQLKPDIADCYCWSLNPDKPFTVASAYKALCSQISIFDKCLIDAIWLKWSPPRVRVFTWKVAHDTLPTRWNILSRGIIYPDFGPICSLCDTELESQNHLFNTCPSAIYGALEQSLILVEDPVYYA